MILQLLELSPIIQSILGQEIVFHTQPLPEQRRNTQLELLVTSSLIGRDISLNQSETRFSFVDQ